MMNQIGCTRDKAPFVHWTPTIMLTRRQSLLALLSLSIASSRSIAPPALAASDGRPDKLVAGLYERIRKHPEFPPLPGFGLRKSDRRLLSESLRELWAKTDAKAKRIRDQLGPIGFDLVTNAQDGGVKSYEVTITEIDVRSAIVKARFDRGPEFSEAERIDVVEFRLVDERGWKIDDIRGKSDETPWTLRELLENYLNNPKF